MKACKKILCLVFALLMCFGALGVLASCKKNPQQLEPPAATKDPSATQEENVDPAIRNDLNEYYDFDQTKYRILCRTQTNYEFKTAEEVDKNAASMELAVFKRNSYIEEHCNVRIDIKERMGNWDDQNVFITAVRNNSFEKNSQYDLVATQSAYLATLGVQGYGYDLTDVPHLDMSKRWWNKQYYEAANYNGAVYTMLGDIAYSLYEYILVIFFNENLAIANGIEDIYDVVLDDEWTFELLQEYTKKIATDLTTPDYTQYGLLANGHGSHAMLATFGLQMLPKNTDTGLREVPLSIPDQLLTPLDAYVKFVNEIDQVRVDFAAENSIDVQNPIFSSGRALFYEQKLGQASYFKSTMETGFGVIPYPKYNTSQFDYCTDYCDDLTGIMIPDNIKDPEMVGVVTEMMCMKSYEIVTYQFYEQNMQIKMFEKPECKQTLERIRSSLTPDFAKIYGASLATPTSMVGNTIEQKESLSGYWGTHQNDWTTSLEKLYQNLDKLAADRAAEANGAA